MLALNARFTNAQQLKDHTKEYHEAAEASLIPRIGAVRDPEDYISLLKLFYGYYHPLEKKIMQFIDETVVPDFKQRCRSSLIVADLQAMGAGISAIPQTKKLPPITGTAEALGALYVLEGSTLGGRYIARMLSQQYPALQPHQLKFFTGYGTNTGIMWTRFVTVLNEFATDAYTVRQMTDTANHTFLHLDLWFNS